MFVSEFLTNSSNEGVFLPILRHLQSTHTIEFVMPLVEATPSYRDRSIDTDEHEKRPFGNDLQIVFSPDIDRDEMLAPSFRDIIRHFRHRSEPHILPVTDVDILESIGETLDMVDGEGSGYT